VVNVRGWWTDQLIFLAPRGSATNRTIRWKSRGGVDKLDVATYINAIFLTVQLWEDSKGMRYSEEGGGAQKKKVIKTIIGIDQKTLGKMGEVIRTRGGEETKGEDKRGYRLCRGKNRLP